MHWHQHLERILVSPDDAVGAIQSGDRIFIHGAAATPHVLIEALARRAPSLNDCEAVHVHTYGPYPFTSEDLSPHIWHKAIFIGSNTREGLNAGRADYLPLFLYDVPSVFGAEMPIDVALLNLSWPDAHGFCSYGTGVDCTKIAAESARVVIAQLNHAMPRTLGDSFIHISRITAATEVSEPPVVMPPADPDEIDFAIGGHVAELVEDGATLQIGAGRVPNAVLRQLGDRKDLGIHTELLQEGIVDLYNAGVVTGRAKSLDRGKIVASLMFGAPHLYDFAHDNPALQMMPAEYTNDIDIIRRQHKMVSINSAIQVDLTGQVAAESIGDQMFSGVGGQVDFVRGATMAPGGKSIISLRSTAEDGGTSRIVPYLDFGGWVTTTRANVQYIVTEHGIANLRGKSVSERVKTMIGIADPRFRDELTEYARERKWLGRGIW